MSLFNWRRLIGFIVNRLSTLSLTVPIVQSCFVSLQWNWLDTDWRVSCFHGVKTLNLKEKYICMKYGIFQNLWTTKQVAIVILTLTYALKISSYLVDTFKPIKQRMLLTWELSLCSAIVCSLNDGLVNWVETVKDHLHILFIFTMQHINRPRTLTLTLILIPGLTLTLINPNPKVGRVRGLL